ncbi:hypothetical protein MB818_01775 [Ruegeria sp. 1NDH52C]|uniref:PAS domain-containing protein n=1 Tax=Ruegeria alba TaxID=2916756 RepID=A0ABS9NRR1_9RHOB|nr:hypothetical protein [Ruegeria alba]MCG6556912.1 hypothetical protein [Ruegeria alba]
MTQTPAMPNAQKAKPTFFVFAGWLPSLSQFYGLEYPGKARVSLSGIHQYLSANPERIAQLIHLTYRDRNGQTVERFIVGYRTIDGQDPDQWVAEIYEISQAANQRGQVAQGWNKVLGSVLRENTFLLNLLRKEAKRRPEAAQALRSLVLTDDTRLSVATRQVFRPL